MPAYLHPGVYIEEIPSGAKPIEGVSTSVAALIGYTTEGPIGEATLVHSWDEYKGAFGGIHSETDVLGLAAFNFFLNGGRDAYVARLAKDAKAATLPTAAPAKMPGRGGAATINVLAIEARSAGAWGNGLSVNALMEPNGYRFKLQIRQDGEVAESLSGVSMDPSDAAYALTVVNAGSKLVKLSLPAGLDSKFKKATSVSGDLTAAPATNWASVVKDAPLTLNIDNLGAKTITLGDPGVGGYDGAKVAAEIAKQVLLLGPNYVGFTCTYDAGSHKLTLTSGQKSASSSVQVRPGALASALKLGKAAGGTELHGTEDVVPASMGTPAAPTFEALTGGDDGVAPGLDDYNTFFAKLRKVRDVNMILLPGQTMPASGSGNQVIAAAVAHCEETASRMVLVDPASGYELAQQNDVDALSLSTSTYAALYYPWVKVANPFYDRDTNATAPTTLTVAPSSFAAGLWARTDGTRGVWKAPAGVEASVRGLAGLEFTVEDGDQDQLNPAGVNCLRKLPSYGAVLWGTRTLATKANPEWRYVPVRRTAIYIESSIYNGIQWAVFEPNDHRLWSSLRANIGAFMDGLFRAGAFQGQKASDAYFVRCGLGDTMTQDDIDRGMVIAIVGFAPLKPAEFVIVRIQQKVGQS